MKAMSIFGPSRRFRHLRYFRFRSERTLVNRMPVWLQGEIERTQDRIEINPKVVLGKPIIRGTHRAAGRDSRYDRISLVVASS